MAHPRPRISRDGEGKHLAAPARPHGKLSTRSSECGRGQSIPAEGLSARNIHASVLGVVGERLPLASTHNVATRNNRPLALRARRPAVQQGSEQRVHSRRPSFCVRAEDEAHWLEQDCQLWHLLQQPNARLDRHWLWRTGRHAEDSGRHLPQGSARRVELASARCVIRGGGHLCGACFYVLTRRVLIYTTRGRTGTKSAGSPPALWRAVFIAPH